MDVWDCIVDWAVLLHMVCFLRRNLRSLLIQFFLFLYCVFTILGGVPFVLSTKYAKQLFLGSPPEASFSSIASEASSKWPCFQIGSRLFFFNTEHILVLGLLRSPEVLLVVLVVLLAGFPCSLLLLLS